MQEKGGRPNLDDDPQVDTLLFALRQAPAAHDGAIPTSQILDHAIADDRMAAGDRLVRHDKIAVLRPANDEGLALGQRDRLNARSRGNDAPNRGSPLARIGGSRRLTG